MKPIKKIVSTVVILLLLFSISVSAQNHNYEKAALISNYHEFFSKIRTLVDSTRVLHNDGDTSLQSYHVIYKPNADVTVDYKGAVKHFDSAKEIFDGDSIYFAQIYDDHTYKFLDKLFANNMQHLDSSFLKNGRAILTFKVWIYLTIELSHRAHVNSDFALPPLPQPK